MPYSNDPFMDLARIGYDAYLKRIASLGLPILIDWGQMTEEEKLGWRAAAKAMKLHVDDHPWPVVLDDDPSEEIRRKMAARP